jgi:GNAT superfamily N-acetyltransferase
MTVAIVERLPDPLEFNALRASAGWGTYELEALRACLPRSLYGVCACDGVAAGSASDGVADGGASDGVAVGGATVGMARVVGDGGLVCYIQDLVVLPAWRGQGIARRMMDAVMAWVRANMVAGAVVGLMAAAGLESFYASYGFRPRPDGRYGAGMHWLRPSG